MRTSTILFGAAGLLLFVYISNLGQAIATISVIFKTVIINSPLNYTVVLTVQNITNASVTINSMTGVLNLYSNPIANLSDFTPRIVPPNNQVDIPVTVSLSLLDLPEAVQNVITNQTNKLDFTVTGNINVSGLIVPFNLSNTITI